MAAHPLSLVVIGWIHLKVPANMLQHEAKTTHHKWTYQATLFSMCKKMRPIVALVLTQQLDPDLLTLLSRLQPVIGSNLVPPNNLFLLGSSEPLVHILDTWNIEVRFHQW